MPLVSVIIPTFNAAEFVVEAIQSVLAQTCDDLEVIVVDDGSTDRTADMIEPFAGGVRYIQQENAGVSSARNRGIAESKGKYVAFLDADDTWLPTKLERQLEALRKSPQNRAVDTGYFVTDSRLIPSAKRRAVRERTTLEDLLFRGTTVFVSTVLCEASLLELTGGFDPELSQCADWDMWIRLAVHTEFVAVDEPLVNYRQHGTNMSRNAELLERDSIRVMEKAFSMSALPESLRSRRSEALARNLMVLAGTYFRARRFSDCFRCAASAIALDRKQVAYLASYPSRVAARLKSESPLT